MTQGITMEQWLARWRKLGTVEAYFDWRLRRAKATGGKTVVVTVDAEGTRGMYQFSGKPDWERVRKETVGAGYAVALIPNRTIGECLVLCSEAVSARQGWDKSRGGGIIKLAEKNAILKDVARMQKPWMPQAGERVWWDGVRVYEDGQEDQVAAAGERTIVLDETGMWRAPYLLKVSCCWTTLAHLKPLPEKPKPEPTPWNTDDWCYISGPDEVPGIGRVVAISVDGGFVVQPLKSDKLILVNKPCLRPLTDEDWTVNIGGIRVRAYDGEDGRVFLLNSEYAVTNVFFPNARPIVERLGIPIMPYALSKGHFKRPE